MSSPLAGVSVVNAVAFGTYGTILRNLETDNSMSSILINHGVAGAAGGLAQTPLASTLELAKTRMQLQVRSIAKCMFPDFCKAWIPSYDGLVLTEPGSRLEPFLGSECLPRRSMASFQNPSSLQWTH